VDSELIYRVEVDVDESHADHDMKSVRSLKSYKSIRSEVHIVSSKNSDNPDRNGLEVHDTKNMTQPLS
jgi:hypothetical protein